MMSLREIWKRWVLRRKTDATEGLAKSDPPTIVGYRSDQQKEMKVVGYFAYLLPFEVLCDEGACLIAGSEAAMRDYLAMSNQKSADRYSIKKTRFGEILNGMYLGDAYAFDDESYRRFYPLALEEGLAVCAAEFTDAPADQIKFVTVAPI